MTPQQALRRIEKFMDGEGIDYYGEDKGVEAALNLLWDLVLGKQEP